MLRSAAVQLAHDQDFTFNLLFWRSKNEHEKLLLLLAGSLLVRFWFRIGIAADHKIKVACASADGTFAAVARHKSKAPARSGLINKRGGLNMPGQSRCRSCVAMMKPNRMSRQTYRYMLTKRKGWRPDIRPLPTHHAMFRRIRCLISVCVMAKEASEGKLADSICHAFSRDVGYMVASQRPDAQKKRIFFLAALTAGDGYPDGVTRARKQARNCSYDECRWHRRLHHRAAESRAAKPISSSRRNRRDRGIAEAVHQMGWQGMTFQRIYHQCVAKVSPEALEGVYPCTISTTTSQTSGQEVAKARRVHRFVPRKVQIAADAMQRLPTLRIWKCSADSKPQNHSTRQKSLPRSARTRRFTTVKDRLLETDSPRLQACRFCQSKGQEQKNEWICSMSSVHRAGVSNADLKSLGY